MNNDVTNGQAAFTPGASPYGTTPSLAPELIEQLKEKHGEIVVAQSNGMTVALRVAKPGEYKQCRAMMNDPKKRPYWLETLFRYTCVYPPPEQMEAMLQQYPGLADSFGASSAELCGLQDAETKKY